MSLRGFLDACYALLVEDFQRVNPLLSADEIHGKVSSALGITGLEREASAPPKEEASARNEQSMQMLKMMMSGVKGSPV